MKSLELQQLKDKIYLEVKLIPTHIWVYVHGLVGILRRSDLQANKDKRLKWIKNNLEEYLKMTTFK